VNCVTNPLPIRVVAAEEDGMSLRVDTLHWVQPSALIVSSTMLDKGGEEDGRAPYFVLSWPHGAPPATADYSLTQFEVYPMMAVRGSRLGLSDTLLRVF
jgi:hypothetical protein